MAKIVVTGGAGFIGSNFVRKWIAESQDGIVNVDKGTYAAAYSLRAGSEAGRYCAVTGDISDRALMRQVLYQHRPTLVINFAAETHVDRSILYPGEFVNANVTGTFNLLDEARQFWEGLPNAEKDGFRFLQISTDEVYGSLSPEERPCDELKAPAPNSPYAASKAAADQFVRAFHRTYGLPTQIARCCNNYGPWQHPEKLIPLMIHRALRGQSMPIYGDGEQVRDWLYVEDHCAALRSIIARGRAGEVYNISARAERTNLQVVISLCTLLDREFPRNGGSYADLIEHIADRRGHDRRYALDPSKLKGETDWHPRETFESGLARTVRWYIANLESVNAVTDSSEFKEWSTANYKPQ